ncbi:MAG: type V CRISPR-associated protein Cas12k [Nostoc sp. ChiSLP02]|nr:type V CRISPR-associated protein Cas12k [Nostoc sp. DedSLP05]MDZ8099794.1 type V CRISPR-associated protein Cas12k [Nostoc sp. DedSLP01]MDZ8186878.1 type V CRISPR-associated protein Cas12k [Nostoc sp. ChiSLP02]
MSVITIQCRLVASESTRRYLWHMMTEKNTPLINELLEQVRKHSDIEKWLKKGKLPDGVVKPLCDSLIAQERFADQPKRFYKSAIEVVEYIYKSWLALQKERQQKIDKKEHWLNILKSDIELQQECNRTLDVIRAQAIKILPQYIAKAEENNTQNTNIKKTTKSKKSKSHKDNSTLFDILFKAYDKAKNPLKRCTLAYLLKNNCQVTELEENPEQYALRRSRKEKEIERLKEQLKSRKPNGRDLKGQEWLQTLLTATTTVPESDNEADEWQKCLLKKTKYLPFPVQFNTNEDLVWSKNKKGRICVSFAGKGLSDYTFEIYCDNRQLHWFQRFLQDQEIKHNNKGKHSAALFTLRSGRLAWQENQVTGSPWNIHRLTLSCSLDTRFWTTEGSHEVQQEKANEIAQELLNMQQKGKLNQNQQNYVKRLNSTLTKLAHPFPRPIKPLYLGKPSIIVGVSLGLQKPATVAVVDVSTSKVVAYRSVKQLLGKNYKLLNRQRQQQQRNSHERHKAQKNNTLNKLSESELGKHIDNLLAQAIIALAKNYQATSIVLPTMKNVRESIQSEIEARAVKRCPNYKEGQQQYAKQYRQSIHLWSYNRLMECIQTQARKANISIEEGPQPIVDSPQEKARDLAIAAYYFRQNKS